MGLTLQGINIETTDEEWNPCFIDRTSALNKDKPIQKQLKLSNLGVYCNPSDKDENIIS